MRRNGDFSAECHGVQRPPRQLSSRRLVYLADCQIEHLQDLCLQRSFGRGIVASAQRSDRTSNQLEHSAFELKGC
eukprot:g11967.t1